MLDGGAGNDRLSGGGGADTFRFTAGRDVVQDFTDNLDRIGFDRDLWGGQALSGAQILDFANIVGGDAVFEFDNGARLILRGVNQLSSLSDDVFSF